MKTRWRSIFLKALEVQIPFAVEVIDCCAVLHNLCMKTNDLLDLAADDDDDDDDDDASESLSDEEQDPGNCTSADGLRAQVAAAASLLYGQEPYRLLFGPLGGWAGGWGLRSSEEGKERTLPPGADDEPIATGVMLWLDPRSLSTASYHFQVAAVISPPSVLLPVEGFFNS
ncbi:hypothetical protein SKAU_G00156490 [Synaphobranchus kaupii]|uniref:DDE Tnp4 domain-containing protein n=1 Tax=Synaphobranchus kaupii TaxID=118154 RepID=A0A9Q1FI12_SYNKA|nr:hypothetical protein SKAU_G00156490 [Synaphobranchus kaupii]